MSFEFPPRHPDGRIDWLLLEGDVMGGMMLVAIVVLFVYAMAGGK